MKRRKNGKKHNIQCEMQYMDFGRIPSWLAYLSGFLIALLLFILMGALLTGNWKPEFPWNLSGFLNAVKSWHLERTRLVCGMFQESPNVSFLFLADAAVLLLLGGIALGMVFEKKTQVMQCLLVTAACTAVVFGCSQAVSLSDDLLHRVETISQTAAEKIEAWRFEPEDDPMTYGNFSMLDGLETKENPALSVTMTYPESMYLKGYTGEVYDGNGWTSLSFSQADLNDANQLFLQLAENHFSARTILGQAEILTGKKDENQITIENVGTGSRYLYLPYDTVKTECEIYLQIGDVQTKAKNRKDRFCWTLTSAEGQIPEADQIRAELRELQQQGKNEEFFRCEYAYRKFAEENYLVLDPETERELAALLGKKTQLSAAEAGQRIAEVMQDFQYDENVVYRAEEGDFLSCSLKNREGYAPHFATAAALMLRYFGIPARYAEGYRITEEDAENAEHNRMKIDRGHYHAWAEFYEEGIGWIPFEAVPAQEENSAAMNEEAAADEKNREELPQQEVNSTVTEKGEANFFAAFAALLLLVAVVILTAVLLRKCVRKKRGGIRRKDLHGKDPRRSVIAMGEYMLYLQNRRKTAAGDFSETIENEEAGKLYEEARYSNHEISEDKRTRMQMLLSEMKKEWRKRKREQ